MWSNWEIANRIALRSALTYTILSLVWVFLSDFILDYYLVDTPKFVNFLKGFLFVLVTGYLFYNLFRKGIKLYLEQETKYRLIVENVNDLIVVSDEKGKIVFASPSHETVVGYSPEEFEGTTIFDHISKEDIPKILEDWKQSLTKREHNDPLEFHIKHKDGHFVIVEGRGVPVYGDSGEIEKLVLIAHDIRKRKQMESQIRESEAQYRKLVEYSPETILIHVDNKIVFVNNAGVELAGVEDRNQLIGKNVLDFIDPRDLGDMKKRMRSLQEERLTISQHRLVRPDGKQLDVELLAIDTTYQGEEAVQVILRDITERKIAEEQVKYLAYRDFLTDLPNRNSLYAFLGEALERTKERKQSLAILFLDLDRFKMINDTYGHSFGDQLLKQVTSRLRQCIGGEDSLYRYGGDEYIIVLENKDTKQIVQVAEKIIHILSAPIFINDHQTFITTSLGISTSPTDGENEEELIKNADMAMYAAKEKGRNNYQFYTSVLGTSNNRRMDLENGIRNALKNNEFAVYYQPQYDLNTNELIGLEALIRWKHPKYGFISPAEFIPVAEETGLIITIGKWVLETVSKQMVTWKNAGYSQVTVAVNVSAIQFRHQSFVAMVEEIVREHHLDTRYLELELTESVLQHVNETIEIMKQLKELGVKLSIDDFGTGYSSLSYLRQLPIDKLKVDKSFIDEIDNNLNGEVIAQTIIELGNRLGFSVIAEGIETEQQLSFLQASNCQFGQGYFFSKPLPVKEIEEIWKT